MPYPVYTPSVSCLILGLYTCRTRVAVAKCSWCGVYSPQQVDGEWSSNIVRDSVCSCRCTQLRAHHLRHAISRTARSTTGVVLVQCTWNGLLDWWIDEWTNEWMNTYLADDSWSVHYRCPLDECSPTSHDLLSSFCLYVSHSSTLRHRMNI